jgi:hypothetical protein
MDIRELFASAAAKRHGSAKPDDRKTSGTALEVAVTRDVDAAAASDQAGQHKVGHRAPEALAPRARHRWL